MFICSFEMYFSIGARIDQINSGIPQSSSFFAVVPLPVRNRQTLP